MILAIAEGESSAAEPDFVYRNYANAPKTLASAPMAEAGPFFDKAGVLPRANRLDKTGEN